VPLSSQSKRPSKRLSRKPKLDFVYSATDPVGQGLLIIEASRSHSDTPHSVGLLWTSDQPVAENSTWQRTTERHPYSPRDSNPQSRQASCHTPKC